MEFRRPGGTGSSVPTKEPANPGYKLAFMPIVK